LARERLARLGPRWEARVTKPPPKRALPAPRRLKACGECFLSLSSSTSFEDRGPDRCRLPPQAKQRGSRKENRLSSPARPRKPSRHRGAPRPPRHRSIVLRLLAFRDTPTKRPGATSRVPSSRAPDTAPNGRGASSERVHGR